MFLLRWAQRYSEIAVSGVSPHFQTKNLSHIAGYIYIISIPVNIPQHGWLWIFIEIHGLNLNHIPDIDIIAVYVCIPYFRMFLFNPNEIYLKPFDVSVYQTIPKHRSYVNTSCDLPKDLYHPISTKHHVSEKPHPPYPPYPPKHILRRNPHGFTG
jgi:hypothetical protein